MQCDVMIPSYGNNCESIGSKTRGFVDKHPLQEFEHWISMTAPSNLFIILGTDPFPETRHVTESYEEIKMFTFCDKKYFLAS